MVLVAEAGVEDRAIDRRVDLGRRRPLDDPAADERRRQLLAPRLHHFGEAIEDLPAVVRGPRAPPVERPLRGEHRVARVLARAARDVHHASRPAPRSLSPARFVWTYRPDSDRMNAPPTYMPCTPRPRAHARRRASAVRAWCGPSRASRGLAVVLGQRLLLEISEITHVDRRLHVHFGHAARRRCAGHFGGGGVVVLLLFIARALPLTSSSSTYAASPCR